MTIEYYDLNADDFFRSTINVDMSGLYSRFTDYLPKGAHVLDAGCGSGRDSLAFLNMGYKVTAFDASSEMVNRASEFTGLDVKLMKFQDINDCCVYDGIWSCASLLHVPQKELPKVMRKLLYSLKKDGFLYVSFKYGDSERYKEGRFFSDMTKSSLTELISSLDNAEIEDMWITIDKRPDRVEKWINAVVKNF